MKKVKLGLLVLIPALFVALGILSGCKKSNNTKIKPGANEVWMENTAFNPSSLTVSVNTTIKWTNKDAVAHTVTSNSGLFNSGNIESGGVFSYTFTTAGTYTYKCLLHPIMSGTVIVK